MLKNYINNYTHKFLARCSELSLRPVVNDIRMTDQIMGEIPLLSVNILTPVRYSDALTKISEGECLYPYDEKDFLNYLVEFKSNHKVSSQTTITNDGDKLAKFNKLKLEFNNLPEMDNKVFDEFIQEVMEYHAKYSKSIQDGLEKLANGEIIIVRLSDNGVIKLLQIDDDKYFEIIPVNYNGEVVIIYHLVNEDYIITVLNSDEIQEVMCFKFDHEYVGKPEEPNKEGNISSQIKNEIKNQGIPESEVTNPESSKEVEDKKVVTEEERLQHRKEALEKLLNLQNRKSNKVVPQSKTDINPEISDFEVANEDDMDDQSDHIVFIRRSIILGE